MAFGILGLGVFLAAVLWSIPVLRRRRQVRQFRKALTHIDMVAISWSHALREDRGATDVPIILPEDRRGRRHRRDHPDDGSAAVA